MMAFLIKLAEIWWQFCQFGLLCFGGGYVLTPLYITAFVNVPDGIPMHDFGNLLAVTQITPGPISINAATFFGFRKAGALGALFATAALLTPSYFLLIAALKSLEKWKRSKIVQGLMWGVAPATMAMMASAALVFLQVSVFKESWHVRPFAAVLCAGTVWCILKTHIHIVWIILVCALLGAVAFA